MNIRKLRERKKISQQKLADSLGVSQQTIAKWECGKSFPRSGFLPAISKELGCTIRKM